MFAIRSWIRCGINRTDSESFEICAASRSTARSHVQKRLKTMFFCFIFGGLIYLDMRGMYGVCHVKVVWSGTQLYWFRIFSYMFLHFLTCSYSFLYFPSWETHILCWMGHSVFSSAQHPWSPPSAHLHLVLLWLDVENPMGKSNRKMICKCGCSTSMLVYRRVHIKLYIIYTCAQKKDIKLSNWGPIIDITIEAGWSVKVHFFSDLTAWRRNGVYRNCIEVSLPPCGQRFTWTTVWRLHETNVINSNGQHHWYVELGQPCFGKLVIFWSYPLVN